MMTEIPPDIPDVSENPTRTGAPLVSISVTADMVHDKLTIVIAGDGRGMTAKQVAHVTDSFSTIGTARKIGLGTPSFKYAAESTGGSFHIKSEPGKGAAVTTVLGLSRIDRTPLGGMNAAIHDLTVYHPDTDFVYTYAYNDAPFILDIREMREILGRIPLNGPEIFTYIMEFLRENQQEVDGGAQL